MSKKLYYANEDINDLVEQELEKSGRGPDKQPRKKRGEGPRHNDGSVALESMRHINAQKDKAASAKKKETSDMQDRMAAIIRQGPKGS